MSQGDQRKLQPFAVRFDGVDWHNNIKQYHDIICTHAHTHNVYIYHLYSYVTFNQSQVQAKVLIPILRGVRAEKLAAILNGLNKELRFEDGCGCCSIFFTPKSTEIRIPSKHQ